jgi:hypothetical protein
VKGLAKQAPMLYCSKAEATPSSLSLITMTKALSYLQRIEEDRQNQQYGWGIRKDNDKWEVYEWQRLSELSIHTQGLALFDEKWQAEQYINNILHG